MPPETVQYDFASNMPSSNPSSKLVKPKDLILLILILTAILALFVQVLRPCLKE